MIRIKETTDILGHMEPFNGNLDDFHYKHDQYPSTPVVVQIFTLLGFEYFVISNEEDWNVLRNRYISGMYFFLTPKHSYFKMPLRVKCPACGNEEDNTNAVVYCNNCERGFVT